MKADDPEILERDGDVVRIVAGEIEAIAEMIRKGDEITLRRFSMDGGGPGTVGFKRLKALARRFAAKEGVRVIWIYGTIRTTGGESGKETAGSRDPGIMP